MLLYGASLSGPVKARHDLDLALFDAGQLAVAGSGYKVVTVLARCSDDLFGITRVFGRRRGKDKAGS